MRLSFCAGEARAYGFWPMPAFLVAEASRPGAFLFHISLNHFNGRSPTTINTMHQSPHVAERKQAA